MRSDACSHHGDLCSSTDRQTSWPHCDVCGILLSVHWPGFHDGRDRSDSESHFVSRSSDVFVCDRLVCASRGRRHRKLAHAQCPHIGIETPVEPFGYRTGLGDERDSAASADLAESGFPLAALRQDDLVGCSSVHSWSDARPAVSPWIAGTQRRRSPMGMAFERIGFCSRVHCRCVSRDAVRFLGGPVAGRGPLYSGWSIGSVLDGQALTIFSRPSTTLRVEFGVSTSSGAFISMHW